MQPNGFRIPIYWLSVRQVWLCSWTKSDEITTLRVPCFTIRNNTERPITITEGTNILVGTSKEGIVSAIERFKSGFRKEGKVPELWDGKAAERIVDKLTSLA